MSIDLTESRKEFETRAYAEYFVRSVRVDPNSQFFKKRYECVELAEFAKRDEQGFYIREGLEPMWFGWRMRNGELD